MSNGYQETLEAAVAAVAAATKTLEGIMKAAPAAAPAPPPVRVFTIGEAVSYDGGRGEANATVLFDPRSTTNFGTKVGARSAALTGVAEVATGYTGGGDQVIIILDSGDGRAEGGAYLSSIRAASRSQLS